ncbi:hypothetical protein KXS11_01890 [Plantibacter flavus]|uniref:hypothetical protein n=1 Tax=Plantibacter flavus TaxID=150123 RepID=UPI003F169AB9
MRTLGGVAVVAALLLAMTACTSPEPAPTATPSSTAPSPTTTPRPTVPESSYGFGCANLVPQDVLATALAPSVELDPAFTHAQDRNPLMWAVSSLGGLHCTWSNGVPLTQSEGGTPLGTERFAQVTILPDAHADWDSYFERWADGETGPWEDSTTLACFTQDGQNPGVCSINFLVGDSWVDVRIDGPADNAASSDEEAAALVTPFLEAIRSALEPVGTAARFDWAGQAPGLNTLPTECASFVSEADMSTTFGQELTYSSVAKKRMWNLRVAADDFGAPDCIFSLPDSDSSRGLLTALPGGRWAYEQMLESRMSAGEDIQTVSIDGLGARDAFLECASEPWLECNLQLTVAGHWLDVQVSNVSSLDGTYALEELGAQATAYAKLAASNLLAIP